MDDWSPEANGIFLKVIAVPEGGERQQLIEQLCAGNGQVQSQVRALLAAVSSSSPESVADDGQLPDSLIETAVDQSAGRQIGPYTVVRQIGQGGFGIVYLADQEVPIRRRVALKVLRPGRDGGQVLSRFAIERQTLSLMEHPGIARALDAGVAETGQPYFVMEYVPGRPINAYCDRQQLTVRERLALVVDVCRAVQHAHQKGIIHRDIKPSNVLVAQQDGVAVPKIIDFGIAKAVEEQPSDDTFCTRAGEMIGTPLYMSPEQARGESFDIDTRSDIYSLGAMLYELLTGVSVFDKGRLSRASFEEIRRIIAQDEPLRPSLRMIAQRDEQTAIAAQRRTDPVRLRRLLTGDLDWIVMKALDKDRGRRYETADALAADLTRYLQDEPVLARPPGAAYRFRKFARRNRIALTTAAVVVASLVVGTVVSVRMAVRALRAEQLAEQRLQAAQASTQQTRRQITDYFTKVSEDELVEIPGMEQMRLDLLGRALKYYEGFVQESAADPALRMERIAAQLRVAKGLYQTNQNNESIAALRKSLDLLDELLRDDPTAWGKVDVLAGLIQRGRILQFVALWPDDIPQAIDTYGRAIETWERFERTTGDNENFRRDLAQLHIRRGELQLHVQEADRAIQSFQSSARLLEALAFRKTLYDGPLEYEYRAGLADSCEAVGVVLQETVRREEAEAALRRGLRLREEMQEVETALPNYRADVANSHFKLARALARFNRPHEAEVEFRKSLAIWETLVQQYFHFPGYRKQLAGVYERLGELQWQEQKSQDAIESLARAAEVRWTLSEGVYGEEADNHFESIAGSARLMHVLREAGRTDDAEAQFHRVLTANALAATLFPPTELPYVMRVRNRIALGEIWIGRWYLVTGRLSDGEPVLRRAIATFQELVNVTPHPLETGPRLALGRCVLGDLLAAKGRRADADATYRQAIAGYEALLADELREPTIPAEWSECYRRYAEFLVAHERVPQAEEAVRQWISKGEELVRRTDGKPVYVDQVQLAQELLVELREQHTWESRRPYPN